MGISTIPAQKCQITLISDGIPIDYISMCGKTCQIRRRTSIKAPIKKKKKYNIITFISIVIRSLLINIAITLSHPISLGIVIIVISVIIGVYILNLVYS